ncbi:uncharacterized protein LOC134818913 [Bolinopsis microptera]|uniref:uncharacterized protein LOC134818913 n=1 Tax=Bolinopsis microptera TaxID=2820187 RepID=UPI00307A5C93
MLRVIILFNIILVNLSGILGQSFGDTIKANPVIEIDAGQRLQNSLVKVTEFDIYREEDEDEDYLALTVQVPAEVDSSNVKNLFILDFSAYTTKDNPIEGDSINSSRISNCSNYQVQEPQTLAAQFDQFSENNFLSQDFFSANLTEIGGTYFLQYIYKGSLERFSNCQVYDRDEVWSVSESNTGKTQYTTVLAINHIRITKQEIGNETIYQPSFFSTAFKLSWTISQYIFVNGVVTSQKRVKAEVIFASVQPLWENGKITDKTRVHIGVRTILENAYHSHLMMVFVKGSDSGTFAVLEDGETPIEINAEKLSSGTGLGDQVMCDPVRNWDLADVFDDNSQKYQDCQQTWEFSIMLPQNVTVYNEIEGLFSFRLQLYQCDDLNQVQPICAPVEDMYEEILANVALDTVVEITAEQENSLKLEVTAIKSQDNSAEFLSSSTLSRGIYHGEEVVIYIQPTQNINKTPGADLISKNGLALSAFLICIQSQIPLQSKLGCLDVDQQYRYIPWMEDDLSVSLHGKIYKREDFESTKQDLNSTQHNWDPDTGYYTIRFQNLALSAQSRLYRFTMIFRIDILDSDSEGGRRRRSVLLSLSDSSLAYRKKRATKVASESATVVSPEEELAQTPGPGEKELAQTPGLGEEELAQTPGPVEEDYESDKNDTSGSEASDDSTSLATTEVSVKVEVCPPDYEYISQDEPCRPKLRESVAFTVHCNILMLLLCLGLGL